MSHDRYIYWTINDGKVHNYYELPKFIRKIMYWFVRKISRSSY